MSTTTLSRQSAEQTATLNRLRNDLSRCIVRADVLGLSAIAIYLQRALDELDVRRVEEHDGCRSDDRRAAGRR